MWMRGVLPARHFEDDSKDTVKLGIGLVSVTAAVFLVLEMDGPFVGVLKASSDPLRYAYAHLNQ